MPKYYLYLVRSDKEIFMGSANTMKGLMKFVRYTGLYRVKRAEGARLVVYREFGAIVRENILEVWEFSSVGDTQ